MAQSARPRVFLDISSGTEPAGRLIIELFTDKAPKTCQNFRALCTGTTPPLTYKSSVLHRVIDEFMIQGGDTTSGDGTGGASIYGEEFEDENLGWRDIDKEGLVCMANRGKGTNSSQFFITLAPTPHLNGVHTIFGHLVSPLSLLHSLAKTPVDDDDCPLTPLIITHCGELERRGGTKPTAPPQALAAKSSDKRAKEPRNHDRGRGPHRHRSRSRSHSSNISPPASPSAKPPNPTTNTNAPPTGRFTSASPSPSPNTSNHHRKRSDAAVDETLRGRERRRHTTDKTSTTDARDAPPAQKRESSPSRMGEKERERDRERSKSPGYRRRRSLPNHYRERRAEEERERERGYRDRRSGGARYDHYSSSKATREGEVEPAIKFKGRGSMKYREKDPMRL